MIHYEIRSEDYLDEAARLADRFERGVIGEDEYLRQLVALDDD